MPSTDEPMGDSIEPDKMPSAMVPDKTPSPPESKFGVQSLMLRHREPLERNFLIHRGHGTGDAAVGLQGQFRIDGHFKTLVWNGQRTGPKNPLTRSGPNICLLSEASSSFRPRLRPSVQRAPLKPHPVAVGGHESTVNRSSINTAEVAHPRCSINSVNGTDQFAIDFHFLGGKRGVAFVERDLLGLRSKEQDICLTVGQLRGALLAEQFHGKLLHHMLDPAKPNGLNGRSFFKGLTIKNHQLAM